MIYLNLMWVDKIMWQQKLCLREKICLKTCLLLQLLFKKGFHSAVFVPKQGCAFVQVNACRTILLWLFVVHYLDMWVRNVCCYWSSLGYIHLPNVGDILHIFSYNSVDFRKFKNTIYNRKSMLICLNIYLFNYIDLYMHIYTHMHIYEL